MYLCVTVPVPNPVAVMRRAGMRTGERITSTHTALLW